MYVLDPPPFGPGPSTGNGGSGTTSGPATSCDWNQEYLSCGSPCPPSCSGGSQSQICSSQCLSGCFCKDPYVFQDGNNWRNSPCVLPSACGNGNNGGKSNRFLSDSLN